MNADATGAAHPWSGVLTLFPGAVLFDGAAGDAPWHTHHAVQILRAETEPLVLTTRSEDGELSTRETRAALIPSGVAHEVQSTPQPVLLLLVEPYGPRGKALRDSATATAARLRAAERALEKVGCSELRGAGPEQRADALLGAVAPTLLGAASLSAQVRDALHHIERAAPHGEVRIAQVAAAVSLSPSRLTHRFSREVGIPFRRYVLWVRIRLAVIAVGGGTRGLADAAAAGLSDGAHLSRVFAQNFGLPPSALLRMSVAEKSWAGPRLLGA